MNNREGEILERVKRILIKYLNPSQIILFGSRAANRNSEHADFDFAVDCARPKISIQREINEEVEKISGLYKVDVIYLGSVDKEFREIVLKTGKVVYERGN